MGSSTYSEESQVSSDATVEKKEPVLSGVHKFRKKPVLVDAILFTGSNFDEVISFTNGKAKMEGIPFSPDAPDRDRGPWISIETKEGKMWCFDGDYIIKEPFPTGDRDFYPCKPDIFKSTYEPADQVDVVQTQEDKKMTFEQAEKLVKDESFVIFAGSKYRFAGLYPEGHAFRTMFLMIYDEPPSLHTDSIKIDSCELVTE